MRFCRIVSLGRRKIIGLVSAEPFYANEHFEVEPLFFLHNDLLWDAPLRHGHRRREAGAKS